jgi:DnaJ family protein C protein 8
MRRVLAAFKLNPYEVLDIPLSAVYDDPDSIATLVKKTYRTKSLLIHPFVPELCCSSRETHISLAETS